MRTNDAVDTIAFELARRAGLTNPRVPRALPGGRNNRVFRVDSDAGLGLLKLYFHHPDDTRDRLKHEFGFLEHLRANGSTRAATPLATAPEAFAGLMEFIEGERIGIEQVTATEIDKASAFFLEANANRASDLARSLPVASEACFSLAQHLETTQRRMDRLRHIGKDESVDIDAERFVTESLLPLWREIRLRVEGRVSDPDAVLSPPARVLSPSDFGFHNALREPSGRLRFVDFEFAGWDDPAKLICDFKNQPDMLLERALTDRFTQVVLNSSPEPRALEERAGLLEPVYQVKWACICLNDFLDWGERRRQFTEDRMPSIETRKQQLAKARVMARRAQSLMEI